MLAETLRAGQVDHWRHVGDPRFVQIDAGALLEPGRMRARRARLSLERTHAVETYPADEQGTQSFVAVDAAGNVAAVTTSLNDMFGARLMTAHGFPLNDQLKNFADERQNTRYRATSRPNAPRAGARPAASIAPTLVLRGDRPVLVLAASGGERIPATIVQTLLARLLFDGPLAQSAAGLRVHTPSAGGLRIEPGASTDLIADLERRGEVVMSLPDFSAVAAIGIDQQGRIEAAADPRKGGQSIVQ
jgi:gamma-glutamyltranspeptidase/glutathione hydrolase